VWLSVATSQDAGLTRSVRLPGGRADVRERATTVAMHLIRRALLDEADVGGLGETGGVGGLEGVPSGEGRERSG
jgi:hypothetical protein